MTCRDITRRDSRHIHRYVKWPSGTAWTSALCAVGYQLANQGASPGSATNPPRSRLGTRAGPSRGGCAVIGRPEGSPLRNQIRALAYQIDHAADLFIGTTLDSLRNDRKIAARANGS